MATDQILTTWEKGELKLSLHQDDMYKLTHRFLTLVECQL